uniref:Uncharacterized protein n=1 Tax=Brassica oleracea TaxID=3712 RepID=A0A3P6CBD7_BRAOL|nr:unnamed protein product [Brassica oleracea]
MLDDELISLVWYFELSIGPFLCWYHDPFIQYAVPSLWYSSLFSCGSLID